MHYFGVRLALFVGLLLILGRSLAFAQASACPTDSKVLANILNTAAGVTENYSGYSFVTISGLDLPVIANAIPQLKPGESVPPTLLGVSVSVDWSPAFIFSYTAKTIQILTPRLRPGCYTLYVQANGKEYLETQIYFNATAPGLFTRDGQNVVASHLDWSLVSANAPAQAGEWISLWASGLGPTNPSLPQGQLPLAPTQLADLANFKILLNGIPVDSSLIGYAGVAPGYAGLYQINFRMPALPAGTGADAQIQLQTGDNVSPPGRYLSVRSP